MTKKLPHSNEIEEATKAIRGYEFLYLAAFADLINRYIDTTLFKRDVFSRLRWGALSLLIVRGGSLTPTQLARLLFRSKHSITKVVDTLEKDGLVIRERVDKDRRIIHVKVTSEGLDFVTQTLCLGAELTQKVMSTLDKDEGKILVNLIRRLRRATIDEIPRQ